MILRIAEYVRKYEYALHSLRNTHFNINYWIYQAQTDHPPVYLNTYKVPQ